MTRTHQMGAPMHMKSNEHWLDDYAKNGNRDTEEYIRSEEVYTMLTVDIYANHRGYRRSTFSRGEY